jgi:hypothetical protein
MLCELLYFKSTEYGDEIYIHKDKANSDDRGYEKNQILNIYDFDKWIDSLEDMFCMQHEIFEKKLSKEEYRDLKKFLISIYTGEEVELTYQENFHHRKIFKNPYPIRTYTSLKWNTRELLESEWDRLLVVAETGEWLNNDSIKHIVRSKLNQGKFLIVILSDETKVLEKEKPDNILTHKNTYYKRLPWWAHNKHMTIRAGHKMPLSAIYFNRRMKTNYIEAVKLLEDDCRPIFDTFFAYYVKAEKFKNHGSVSYEVTEKDISKAKDLIFSDRPYGKETV